MLTPLSILILGALSTSSIILLAIIFGQSKGDCDEEKNNKSSGKDK